MTRIDDFNWFKPDAGDDAREEEFSAKAEEANRDARWAELRDGVTPDGVKGGQGRSAESVRSDAIGILMMVGLALTAALLIWVLT